MLVVVSSWSPESDTGGEWTSFDQDVFMYSIFIFKKKERKRKKKGGKREGGRGERREEGWKEGRKGGRGDGKKSTITVSGVSIWCSGFFYPRSLIQNFVCAILFLSFAINFCKSFNISILSKYSLLAEDKWYRNR